MGNIKVIHIMIGLPKSGKSTIARALGHPIVSEHDSVMPLWHMPDIIFQTRRYNEVPMPYIAHRVREIFHDHDHVTIDAPNLTKSFRDYLRTLAPLAHYHFVPTSLEECCRRCGDDHRARNWMIHDNDHFALPWNEGAPVEVWDLSMRTFDLCLRSLVREVLEEERDPKAVKEKLDSCWNVACAMPGDELHKRFLYQAISDFQDCNPEEAAYIAEGYWGDIDFIW